VLLHGAFGVAESWAPMLPALTKGRQIVILEQQGHGRTADRSGPLTYEQMADDTAALLRQLNVGPADVFGYSDGGIVALGVAIRAPDLVRRVAIFGSNAGAVKDTHEPEMYEAFAKLPADFAPAEFKDPYDRVAPDKTKWPELVRKIKEMGLGFKGYSDADVRSIKAVTLIMQGDRDIVRPEHAVQMFRMIPRSQLAILAGTITSYRSGVPTVWSPRCYRSSTHPNPLQVGERRRRGSRKRDGAAPKHRDQAALARTVHVDSRPLVRRPSGTQGRQP
jgi:pimeloyl-ACP methyl ester carboxylesterase